MMYSIIDIISLFKLYILLIQTSYALLSESSASTGSPFPWCSLLHFCVPLPILVIFSWIRLTRTLQFSRWVQSRTLCNGNSTSLLVLEMFCLEHLRIRFAFFTDASHYFRNLIPLKGTIRLKLHWNKLIPTLSLCWLSKQYISCTHLSFIMYQIPSFCHKNRLLSLTVLFSPIDLTWWSSICEIQMWFKQKCLESIE